MKFEELKEEEIKKFFEEKGLVVYDINKVHNRHNKVKGLAVFFRENLEKVLIDKLSWLSGFFDNYYIHRTLYVNDKVAKEILPLYSESVDLTKEWVEFLKEKTSKKQNKSTNNQTSKEKETTKVEEDTLTK